MEFYDGFYGSLKKINEKPVATVTDTIKLPRRCFERRTLWDILKKDSYIYNGDTIRTDANSQTTICFYEDGLELTLASNTMTRISVDKNNKLEVFLSSGSILVDSVRNNLSAKIIYNKTNVSVNGKAMFSAAEVEVPHGETFAKKLEVQVLDGEVDVESQGQERVVVQNGQMVTVALEEKKDDVVGNPVLIEESIESHEFVLLPQDVAVSAMPMEKTSAAFLFSEEYSDFVAGPYFESLEETQELKKEFGEEIPLVKAQEGHVAKVIQLFLTEDKEEEVKKTARQVKTEKKAKKEKKARKQEKPKAKADEKEKEVKVELPAIGNVKPASGKVFNDEYFIESPSIAFSWSKIPGATHYEFALRKDGRVIHTQTVREKSSYVFTNLEKLSSGRFTWTVRAMDSAGPVSLEKQASFTIKLGKISGDASTNATNYKVNK